MAASRSRTLASRLTAGCVTVVVILAMIGAALGWWWKLRAAARERAQRPQAPAAHSQDAHSQQTTGPQDQASGDSP